MKNASKRIRSGMAMLVATALVLTLSACGQVSDIVSGVAAAGEFPVEIGSVTVKAKPQKAVVLSPSLADVVLALGCETQLTAGSEECTQASLTDLQKISASDGQKIIDLGADLVLAEAVDSNMATLLSNANITVLTITPATDREDFERLYSQVSSAFLGGGAGYDAGVKSAQDIFRTLDDISRIVPQNKVTTACYLYDLNGSAVTGDMFATTLMTYSGVTNAFKSVSGGQYEFESLKVANPDVIFCVPGLKEQIKADSRFKGFKAVTGDRVVELDTSLITWQGRTVVTAAYEISAAAYPELLEETSMTVSIPQESAPPVSSAAASPASAVSDTSSYPELTEGDSGDDVLKIQTRLEELGYLDTEYDGHFGEYTASCIRDFQKANGLEASGQADVQTQRVLFSAKAKAKSAASGSSSSSAV